MGVCKEIAAIGNAKQAISEGKSGPVKIRLTGPVAMALYYKLQKHKFSAKTTRLKLPHRVVTYIIVISRPGGMYLIYSHEPEGANRPSAYAECNWSHW